MKLPEEYWRVVERTPINRGNSERWRSVQQLQVDIEETSALISRVRSDRVFAWRGQCNADFGLSSSLFRKALTIHAFSEMNERRLRNLEIEILRFARSKGLGRGMSDFHLLQSLQHYQVPTRLIDVSREPLSALWFACSDLARKDGRLFMFSIPPDSVRPDDTTLQMVPWATTRLSQWTNKVLLLNSPPSNPRMAAQNGAFVVGGLARNYAGQQRVTRDTDGQWLNVPSDQIHEISELFVKFPIQMTQPRIHNWRMDETYGLTWRIPSLSKPIFLDALSRLGVTRESIYPNFEIVRDGLGTALGLI